MRINQGIISPQVLKEIENNLRIEISEMQNQLNRYKGKPRLYDPLDKAINLKAAELQQLETVLDTMYLKGQIAER